MDEACDEMLIKGELAAKLKVARRTIENWQHKGYLPFLKISNVVIFHWPTVLAHLKANFTVAPRGAVQPASQANGDFPTPLTRPADALSRSCERGAGEARGGQP